MAQSVKEALAEIAEAEKAGNGSVIGEYLGDKRASVQSAAKSAFERMKAAGEEDNTPAPENKEVLKAKAKEKETGEAAPVSEAELPADGESRKGPILPHKWISMSQDEAAEHEEAGRLMGFDPTREIGLLKD